MNNKENNHEKHDSSSVAGGSDSVADHAADGAAHAETATVHPVHTGCELRGEGRALPTKQDTVNTLSGGAPMDVSQVDPMKSPPTQLRDYHDVPFPEGTQPNPDPLSEIVDDTLHQIRDHIQHKALNEIAEKAHNNLFQMLGVKPHPDKPCLPIFTRALQEATAFYETEILRLQQRIAVDGATIAQLRQEKEAVKRIVEDTANAYGKALIRERELRQQLEDNWSCKQKVIAQQTERIRELGKQLEAKEFELQQAWIIANEFGFRGKDD